MKDNQSFAKEILYLHDKIECLNNILWEKRLSGERIEEWLSNFKGDEERNAALYLLSRFIFFNEESINKLVKSLFRDLYRYPIIESIRKSNMNTLDESIIEPEFDKILSQTLFACVGNSSESSSYLQYQLRKQGRVAKHLFEYYVYDPISKRRCVNRSISRCVFIDDFCGTGRQVSSDRKVLETVDELKSFFPYVKVSYYTLVATYDGMEHARKSGVFDEVESVIEMDESFKCFSDVSRIFNSDSSFDKGNVEKMCRNYGEKLMRHFYSCVNDLTANPPVFAENVDKNALGYLDCQLLVGFHHNTPDNTLPVIWYAEDSSLWTPIFPRDNKIY